LGGFSSFFALVFRVLFPSFSGGSLRGIFCPRGAPGGAKGRFQGTLSEAFCGQAHPLKSMVFLKEKLGFQGSGEAPERRKARPFPGGAPGAPLESLLQDFGDFWPPSGVQRGPRFPPKVSFL